MGDKKKTKMFYQYLKYLLLILISIYLSACGFKMYGKSSLPSQLHIIYLQSPEPYSTFTIMLKQTLSANGINLTSSTTAPITLNIIRIILYHNNPNIAPSSQATIYNFTYMITFELRNKIGKSLIGTQIITTTRALTLNPNEVLETSSEVKTMKEEMERELIMQIFNRLDSNNVREALNENKTRTTAITIKK
jgi:LPS-assembly lipoprotein